MKVSLSLLVVLLLFSSCLPYVVKHDVVYAPKVLFSSEVDTLLIVNNTGFQPAHMGHRYVFQDKKGSLLQRTDTFNNEFLVALSNSFRKMGIVTQLEESSVRGDSVYFMTKPADSLLLASLKCKYNADFVLFLDKGVVNGDLKVTKLKDTTALYFNYELSYLTDFHIRDLTTNAELVNVMEKTSTNWEAINASFTGGVNLFAFNELMRNTEIGNMTDQVMRSFFPSAITYDRCLFYSRNINLKDAVRYAKKGRWEDASLIWLYIFKNEDKLIDKLYSSLNLAFHFERLNLLSQTQYWLKIAGGLSAKIDNREGDYITGYIKSVEKRINEPAPQIIGYY